ncbi:class I SAM-dependent methyltransferase [Pseudomonas gessardii]|uniref:Methyltransferase domain-containing protein n=1 Tax=Pseudomonas gessardii TaxID=78544 RepID=A0A7Y1MSY4_9PSED|nr:class I SAM-dependent methyltransferase [Pseudomonas gessardii]NNA70269.1 methyltransferase domain-containing protein [Pseudomonas gessardii]NNA97791.1 methyltransferase domain-containing protein [Pseudomonas gessardii]
MKPQELHQLVFNFRAARAVMFAVQAGLFEELCQEDLTLDELVGRLELHRVSTTILVETLVQLNVLNKQGLRYRVAQDLRATLRRDTEGSIANLLLLDANHWSNWSVAEDFFRPGQDTAFAYDRQSNFAAAMQQGVGDMNVRLAQVLLAHEPRHIVDVGSGPGLLIEQLLATATDLTYTLVDFANTLEIAKGNLSDYKHFDVNFLAHDIVLGKLEVEADCIVTSRLLMGFDEPEAKQILANMCHGLARDGVLVINEFDTQTKVGALMSLDMLVNCGARVYGREQLAQCLDELGFEIVSEQATTVFTRALSAKRKGI